MRVLFFIISNISFFNLNVNWLVEDSRTQFNYLIIKLNNYPQVLLFFIIPF